MRAENKSFTSHNLFTGQRIYSIALCRDLGQNLWQRLLLLTTFLCAATLNMEHICFSWKCFTVCQCKTNLLTGQMFSQYQKYFGINFIQQVNQDLNFWHQTTLIMEALLVIIPICDDFGLVVQIFWPEFDKGKREQCAPLSVTFIIDTNRGEPGTQFWLEADGDWGVHLQCSLFLATFIANMFNNVGFHW